MTMPFAKVSGAFALALTCAFAPISASADKLTANDFVVSQDARYYHGQLIRADLVPAGVRTITYAQYVRQQRLAGLQPRTINQMRGVTVAGTIGVFR